MKANNLYSLFFFVQSWGEQPKLEVSVLRRDKDDLSAWTEEIKQLVASLQPETLITSTKRILIE